MAIWTITAVTASSSDTLCSIEHFKVFGYVTNTSLKFLVVVKDEVDSLRLPFEQVRNFFVSLHDLYVEALYNPFYKIGMPLTSERFAKTLVA